jgi:hypothetical protein
MDITSYVISTAMALSQAKIQQAVSISAMKKAMDIQETNGMALAEMIKSVPSPDRLLDIYA